MCLYPKLIRNKKYIPNKKNAGIPPRAEDIRATYTPIGCGKCIECLKKKKREWQVRLNEEIRSNTKCTFITLTFNEDALNNLKNEIKANDKLIENEIAKLAIRRFLERWRKKYGKSLKHWCVTELGHTNTERIHLHGILWSQNYTDITNIWQYGYVYNGKYVNAKTINYIIKYITKIDTDHKWFTPIILCSPGIGADYIKRPNAKLNEFQEEANKETNETYITRSGTKLPLPIYYRNKLYTEDMREYLWMQKLDKETRYVCGEKIDISTEEGKKLYEQTVEYYRKKNKQMGYGDDEKDWNEKYYKRNLRRISKATKLAKTKKNK